MITKYITDKVRAFWQEWGDDTPGEPAIIVKVYTDGVELTQEGSTILVAKHEWSNFLKELKKVQL